MDKVNVYEMDDFYWYAAISEESAIAAFKADMTTEQLEEWTPADVSLLDDECLTELKYAADDGSGDITFADQLGLMVAANVTFPCMFACTEY